MRQNLMIINYHGLFTFHVGLRITHKVCDHLKYYALRMLIEINLLYDVCFIDYAISNIDNRLIGRL